MTTSRPGNGGRRNTTTPAPARSSTRGPYEVNAMPDPNAGRAPRRPEEFTNFFTNEPREGYELRGADEGAAGVGDDEETARHAGTEGYEN
jgi:hypothetical protein